MKESRLFRILYYILEHGRVTADELAEKFEVSTRTIYRDIDWISSAGIPIYASRGRSGGIEIDKGFVINNSMLSEDEKEQILTALNTLKNTNGLYSNDLSDKLSVLFKIKNENWLELDFSTWQYNRIYQNVFDDLKRAILNKKFVNIKYFSISGESTTRKIKPARLIFKSQDWYVYAFCNLRDDFRFFKLSRIRELELLSEVFEDDFSDIIINKKIEYKKTNNIKLKFDKSISYRVYDEFSNIISEDEDYIYTEIELPDNYVTYSYILSFGDAVEVLEPRKIRKNIINIIKNMKKIYKYDK